MRRHRLDRRERKRRKKIIVFSMVGVVCLLSAGYASFSSNFMISGKGSIVEKNIAKELGYSTDGLKVAYDGKEGLTEDGKWKDISGNKLHGELKNFDLPTFTNDCLDFDGIDDYVLMEEMNYENVTMQIVLNYNTLNFKNDYIYSFSSFENGGYGFLAKKSINKNLFDIDINGHYLFYNQTKYQYLDSSNTGLNDVVLNKKYFLSGSYDGKVVSFYENDHKYTIDMAGTIEYPGDNTRMIIGGNPFGTSVDKSIGLLDGQVCSIRIYDRALTDEEVMQNYMVDKQRYNLE